MLKSTLIAVLLLIHQVSHAAPISYNGYTLNEDTNIVTEDSTGMEWLQWDVTSALSSNIAFNDIAVNYQGGSWRLATNSELIHMASTLLPSLSTWDRSSTSEELFSPRVQLTSFSSSELPENWQFEPEIDAFIELFGYTKDLGGPFINFATNQVVLDSILRTSAYSQAGVLSVFDNGTSQGNNFFDGRVLTARVSGGFTLNSSIPSGTGFAFVRTANLNNSLEVSEPSSIFLFFFALILLALSLLKQKLSTVNLFLVRNTYVKN